MALPAAFYDDALGAPGSAGAGAGGIAGYAVAPPGAPKESTWLVLAA